jgi:hypothetical protein
MHVQVPEGDRSTTTVAASALLQRLCWVRKDALLRCENMVEKVILQVPSGERLGLLVLYCESLSAGK